MRVHTQRVHARIPPRVLMTMTSRSRTQPPTRVRPCPSSEILDLIYRGLETALREQCARRYDIPLSLHRLDSSEEEPASSGLRLERRGLIHLVARLTVSYVGGNVYDVRCRRSNVPSFLQPARKRDPTVHTGPPTVGNTHSVPSRRTGATGRASTTSPVGHPSSCPDVPAPLTDHPAAFR